MSPFFAPLQHSSISRCAAIALLVLAWNGLAFCNDISGIHKAAEKDDVAQVEALLNAKPTLISSTWNGETPLHAAAKKGAKNAVVFLLSHGADVNARKGTLCIGQVGGPMSCGGLSGRWSETPLHLAAEKGHLEVAELLVTHGAEIDARQNLGLTPLHLAAWNGHQDLVELLLAHGADVNARTESGVTPLQLAKLRRHKDVVVLLRQHGGF